MVRSFVGVTLCTVAATAMLSAHDWKGMGIDGVFADAPDTAITSRILFWRVPKASCRPSPK